MNLLPSRVSPDWRSAVRPGSSWRAPVLLGTLFVGVSLALILVEARSLSTRLQAARSERNRLATMAAERRTAEEHRRAGRERLARLKAVEGRLARWNEERSLLPKLLRAVSRAVPDAVVLETLGREGADLRITGRARSAAAVAEATAGLSRLEPVEDLELLWVEQVEGRGGEGEQRFSLAGGLRYSSPEPPSFERVEAAVPGREPGP